MISGTINRTWSKIKQTWSNRFASKWVIFLIDIALLVFSLVTAFLLRFNFTLNEIYLYHLKIYLVISVTLSTIAFLIFKPHEGIIRHTSIEDLMRVVWSIVFINGILFLLNLSHLVFDFSFLPILPKSVLIIYAITGALVLIFLRIAIKALFTLFSNNKIPKKNILIYGGGRSGFIVCTALQNDKKSNVQAVGFIDINPQLAGKKILGLPVYAPDSINDEFIAQQDISEVYFAIRNIEPKKKIHIIQDLIKRVSIVVKEIPPIEQWMDTTTSPPEKKMNKVKIEDLLQRSPIKLGEKHINDAVAGKVILVTGAAGSIGSEIVRQLTAANPAKIILLDQAESPIYELQQELKSKYPAYFDNYEFIIANITDIKSIKKTFEVFKPQWVFHAAAYKHVPLMEMNPLESVHVNVFGTHLLANTASANHVEKFVMISTDKAVNPTNVMGATKRAAETYIQSLNYKAGNTTEFITTRFGNVLGSNGSVIPLFEKQIAAGGPITVTDPEITRYFMTIPEACQLVLEASIMGKGGEILLFDMGEPVKIVDLAINMIRLSGLVPGKDIEIKYVGLRPGEKMFEELLAKEELSQPTHHEKILKAQVRFQKFTEIMPLFHNLFNAFEKFDKIELVSTLKQIVPEYVSQNSEFARLDNQDK